MRFNGLLDLGRKVEKVRRKQIPETFWRLLVGWLWGVGITEDVLGFYLVPWIMVVPIIKIKIVERTRYWGKDSLFFDMLSSRYQSRDI